MAAGFGYIDQQRTFLSMLGLRENISRALRPALGIKMLKNVYCKKAKVNIH
jgi:hypothetical protein